MVIYSINTAQENAQSAPPILNTNVCNQIWLMAVLLITHYQMNAEAAMKADRKIPLGDGEK